MPIPITYSYDANGNMITRHVKEGTQFKDYTLNYDAENRLVSVSGAATASFVYDGDSKQVKSVVDGVTTYYVGNHYKVKNSVVTKHYFAGATRLAVRTGGTLSFLLADHIGSSSITTDANGAKTATALYKAFGETRYTLGNLGTDYKFTGQRLQAELGIYWFQSRWMDPSLGRFTQPDTVVPTGSQGTQAWDRYAFVNNNPVRYNDPAGHMITDGCSGDSEGCSITQYQKDLDAQKLALLQAEAAKRQCDAGNYSYCSNFDLWLKRHPKPVSGVHVGYSGQAGYGLEGGVYDQWDFLIDWKEGNLYVVQTVGAFGYGGTPTGMIGEIYAGTSVVHGVPGDVSDISGLLAGPQFDASAEIGLDGFAEVGYVKGLSVDLDSEGNPYYTLGAGYMYTTENSLEFGLNAIPNAIELGGQLGGSESFIMWVIPLW